jgi:HSP20 family protein
MLMRFDPFREFDRITGDVLGNRRQPWMPMDAYKLGDSFTVHFDLPGVDAKSIDLTVEKNTVTVSAERSWQPGEGVDVVIAERPQGAFTRQLFLGDTLDADRIEADYHDGVLTLTIPVSEGARPRKIEVAGSGEQKAIDVGSHETGSD